MKKVLLSLSVVAAMFASCAGNPEGTKAATTEAVAVNETAAADAFKVDTETSTVEWLGTKVTGKHNGTIKIQSGELKFDEAGVINGGNFVIDMNTIEAIDLKDNAEMKGNLEGHLKAEDFFDAAKYPTSKFEIAEVKNNGNGALTVSGNLTIKDVTKNITFEAKEVENTDTKKVLSADFNINRNDWGVNYEGKKDDLISKEINFKINLVAVK